MESNTFFSIGTITHESKYKWEEPIKAGEEPKFSIEIGIIEDRNI